MFSYVAFFINIIIFFYCGLSSRILKVNYIWIYPILLLLIAFLDAFWYKKYYKNANKKDTNNYNVAIITISAIFKTLVVGIFADFVSNIPSLFINAALDSLLIKILLFALIDCVVLKIIGNKCNKKLLSIHTVIMFLALSVIRIIYPSDGYTLYYISGILAENLLLSVIPFTIVGINKK
jgi:hypothetical protein